MAYFTKFGYFVHRVYDHMKETLIITKSIYIWDIFGIFLDNKEYISN